MQGDPVNFTDPSGLLRSACDGVTVVDPATGAATCIPAQDFGAVTVSGRDVEMNPLQQGRQRLDAYLSLLLLQQLPTREWRVQIPLTPTKPTPSTLTPQRPVWCEPDVIEAMNRAWSQSGNAGQSRTGGSMGVEACFNLNGTPGGYRIRNLYTNQRGKMTIRFDIGGNWPTFAHFHIHPRGGDSNGGMPSTPGNNYEGNREGDVGMADRILRARGQPIQIYVMSWHGLAVYDPTTGRSTQLVRGTGFLTGEVCPR